MKPIIYINISILVICTFLLSLFAIFSEKFICYGEYVSWNSKSEKQISVINNWWCIIDQKLLSMGLWVYDEGFWDNGDGHKMLRYVILFSLGVSFFFFLQVKHRVMVSERFWVLKVLSVYGISLFLLAFLLIFSFQVHPNDEIVLIFFYWFLSAAIATYFLVWTKLRYMMVSFFLLIVISLLFENSYVFLLIINILDYIVYIFWKWWSYTLYFLNYWIIFFWYFVLVYFLLMINTFLLLTITKIFIKLKSNY